MYRVEYINGRRPMGVDPEELPWQQVQLDAGIDPNNLLAVMNEVTELEFAADGRETYRVTSVEPEPRNAPTLPPPPAADVAEDLEAAAAHDEAMAQRLFESAFAKRVIAARTRAAQ